MFQMIILVCGFQKKKIVKIGMFRLSCCLFYFCQNNLEISWSWWCILTPQVFRSIDSGSLKGFPSDCKEASKLVSQHFYFLTSDDGEYTIWKLLWFKLFLQNLVCRKNLVIDKSIHTAYVRAIRSAQHFIYIENQYFLGSSYAWPSYVNSGFNSFLFSFLLLFLNP
jgi:hypothetical protein